MTALGFDRSETYADRVRRVRRDPSIPWWRMFGLAEGLAQTPVERAHYTAGVSAAQERLRARSCAAGVRSLVAEARRIMKHIDNPKMSGEPGSRLHALYIQTAWSKLEYACSEYRAAFEAWQRVRAHLSEARRLESELLGTKEAA